MPRDGAPLMTGLENVVSSACQTLRGCAAVVRGLDAERYTRVSRRIAGSTIGQHVRHSIDHFAAIATALGAGADRAAGVGVGVGVGAGVGVIDYDHRDRQTPIEKRPGSAIEALERLEARLAALAEAELAAGVRVRVMTGASGEEAELESTLARELAFAAHHATHHFAMIASIVGEQNEGASGASGRAFEELPPGFGRAPSTLNYERSEARREAPGAS